MTEIEWGEVEPSVATADQHHAEAIDALRDATSFVLVIPAPEGPEGALRVFSAGSFAFRMGAGVSIMQTLGDCLALLEGYAEAEEGESA